MNIFQFFAFLHFKLRLLVSLKCWSICHRRILTIKRCGSRCGSTTDRIVSKHDVSASIIMNNLLDNLSSVVGACFCWIHNWSHWVESHRSTTVHWLHGDLILSLNVVLRLVLKSAVRSLRVRATWQDCLPIILVLRNHNIVCTRVISPMKV